MTEGLCAHCDVDELDAFMERALVRWWWLDPNRRLEEGAPRCSTRSVSSTATRPRCCVDAFCDDVEDDRSPGEARGADGEEGCVSCWDCLHELSRGLGAA